MKRRLFLAQASAAAAATSLSSTARACGAGASVVIVWNQVLTSAIAISHAAHALLLSLFPTQAPAISRR